MAVHEALQQLAAAFDARKGEIVELHFFGGLSSEETADAMGVSGHSRRELASGEGVAARRT